MKAIQIQKTGGPEVLTLVDIPVPKPKPNEALVKIGAIGVNFIDVYRREGRYPMPLPFVDGEEAAGTVVEVGAEVSGFKLGDHVAYTSVVGAYAEYVAVPAARLVHVPDKLDFKQAAAAILQGMTAHYLVHSSYPLKKGETALIHAAAGGTGQLIVQMAKRIGARVIGTAGSDEKCQLAKQAGADEVINYSATDFEAEVKQLTGGRGVDVVYDGVGKATFENDLNVLRPRGYLVLFGGASGAVLPFDPIRLSQKGSLFLTRPTLINYIATRDELDWRAKDVLGWAAEGKLRLRIDHVYPLAQAAEAHQYLEGRKTTGKLVLIP